jgi:hypothetical protein
VKATALFIDLIAEGKVSGLDPRVLREHAKNPAAGITLPVTVCDCGTLLDTSWFAIDPYGPGTRLVCLWCATTARQDGQHVEHLIEGDDFWLPTARTGETR